MPIQLIFITNDRGIAKEAQDAGIDRIMVDLEILGKSERQERRDTLISCHTMEDISAMREIVEPGRLMVRINPIHDKSASEIGEVIDRGADIIMLPMFKTSTEVSAFLKNAGGNVKTCLLLETAQALVRMDEIFSLKGIDEVHIGLNDLHLSMGLDFMFELLSGGIVEYICRKLADKGIRYGFGGIAKMGDGLLPAEMILAEHVRLGSQMVILSRTFHERAKNLDDIRSRFSLKDEVAKIRDYEKQASRWTSGQFAENLRQIRENVIKIRDARGDALSKY